MTSMQYRLSSAIRISAIEVAAGGPQPPQRLYLLAVSVLIAGAFGHRGSPC